MIDIDLIDRSDFPSVHLQNKHLLPEDSCVYFVIDYTGIVLYIGYTTNLRNRWRAHHLLKELAGKDITIRWYSNEKLSDEEMYSVEQDYISFFEPALNREVGRQFTPRQKKISLVVRLSPSAVEVIDKLASVFGGNRNAALEQIIRDSTLYHTLPATTRSEHKDAANYRSPANG